MGTKKRPTAAEAAATANARAYDNVNNTLKKALGGKQRPWMTGELSTSAERLTSVRKPKAPAQPSTNVPTPLATESNEPQPKLPNAASTIATEPSNQPGTLQNPLPEAEGSAIQSNTVATTGTRNQPLDPRPDETQSADVPMVDANNTAPSPRLNAELPRSPLRESSLASSWPPNLSAAPDTVVEQDVATEGNSTPDIQFLGTRKRLPEGDADRPTRPGPKRVKTGPPKMPPAPEPPPILRRNQTTAAPPTQRPSSLPAGCSSALTPTHLQQTAIHRSPTAPIQTINDSSGRIPSNWQVPTTISNHVNYVQQVQANAARGVVSMMTPPSVVNYPPTQPLRSPSIHKDKHIIALLISIEQFVISMTKQQVLSDIENKRIEDLKCAVHEDDLLFLLLHQAYCTWSLPNDSARMAAGFTEEYANGFELVKSILMDNMMLSLGCLTFFAKFPWSYDSEAHKFPKVTEALQTIKLFLKTDYVKVRNARRSYIQMKRFPSEAEIQILIAPFQSTSFTRIITRSIVAAVQKKNSSTQSAINQTENVEAVNRVTSNVLPTRRPRTPRNEPSDPAQWTAAQHEANRRAIQIAERKEQEQKAMQERLQRQMRQQQLQKQQQLQLQNQQISPQQSSPLTSQSPDTLGAHQPPHPQSPLHAAQNNIGLHAPHMLSPQQQLAHQAQNYQQTHGVPHYPQTAQQITPQYNAHNPQRQPEATPSMPHHQQQLQQLHQMEQRQQPIQPNLAFHNTAVYQQLNQQQRHYQTQQQQQQQQQQQLQQLQLQFQQQQQRLQLQHQLLQQQVTPGGQNSAPLPPRPQQPHITSPSFNPTRNSPHLQAQASPLVSPTTVMSPRQQSSTRQRHAAPALLSVADLNFPTNFFEVGLSSPVMTAAQIPAYAPKDSEKIHFSRTGYPIKSLWIPSTGELVKGTWKVLEEEFKSLSFAKGSPDTGGRPVRIGIGAGSIVFRLRCVKSNMPPSMNTDADWASLETEWPRNIFIEINSKRVDLRRKGKWTKDLPADITNFIKEGDNLLQAFILGRSTEKEKGLPSQFYLMLERYEVKSQPTINAELECISADAAKEQIVKRLSLSQSGDDEIIVSTKDVTISVLCPLSLQRIEIPVRGKCCKHFECFDFDTYMSSRPRENPGVPPKDDAYKCPICGGRAKPPDLIRDRFLMEILDELNKEPTTYEGLAHITVDVTGAWKPKVETDEPKRGRGGIKTEDTERKDSLSNQVEVICLDD